MYTYCVVDGHITWMVQRRAPTLISHLKKWSGVESDALGLLLHISQRISRSWRGLGGDPVFDGTFRRSGAFRRSGTDLGENDISAFGLRLIMAILLLAGRCLKLKKRIACWGHPFWGRSVCWCTARIRGLPLANLTSSSVSRLRTAKLRCVLIFILLIALLVGVPSILIRLCVRASVRSREKRVQRRETS